MVKNEIWKDIKGYEGIYQVSNLGRVKSLPRSYKTSDNRTMHIKQRILKSAVDRQEGYIKVALSKNSSHKTFRVHRLVAEAFIPNLNNLPEVNHKDENKSNNCVDNLEWCSRTYNVNYGTAIKRRLDKMKNFPSFSKTVFQYNLNNILIGVWPSLGELRRNGYNYKNIHKCIKRERKKCANCIWSYTPL